MRTSPVFSLCRIAGVPYLLPHGQGTADHKRGIQLNETSVFLWNALQNISTRRELLEIFMDYCEAEPEQEPQLKQDLDDFLNQLISLDIIAEDNTDAKNLNRHLKIGPLFLKLIGPAEAFSDEFAPYETDPDTDTSGHADLTIELTSAACRIPAQGSLLIRNRELCVYETADQYLLLFPQMPQILYVLLSKDGSCAYVSHTPSYTKQFVTDFFHVVRFLFLYTAGRHNCFALHSASILYREKAWLFSGHSGMGKSTHTNLWKELYGVPILNGDLNLISFSKDSPVIYGIPWCGTSGITDPHSYPLGGIILLSRGTSDQCIELSHDQKILLTAQRLISPAWDSSMLRRNLNFMSDLIPHLRVCQLQCTKQPSAAKTIREWIDG